MTINAVHNLAALLQINCLRRKKQQQPEIFNVTIKTNGMNTNFSFTFETLKLTTIDYPLAEIESICDPKNHLAPLLNQFHLDRMHESQGIA